MRLFVLQLANRINRHQDWDCKFLNQKGGESKELLILYGLDFRVGGLGEALEIDRE